MKNAEKENNKINRQGSRKNLVEEVHKVAVTDHIAE